MRRLVLKQEDVFSLSSFSESQFAVTLAIPVVSGNNPLPTLLSIA